MNFVNRVNDVKRVIDELKGSPLDNNRMFFIVARSGVGKSEYICVQGNVMAETYGFQL